MDAQKAGKVGYSKALIALVAGVSCFLIYVLACIVSPVSWSPDYSKIAILVTPPLESKEKVPVPDRCAIFTYDVATGQRVLLDEVEKNGVLSAPSWSPDGKWIAYYRVEPNLPREAVSSSEADPNVSQTPPASAVEGTARVQGPEPNAEDLFSEENMMLPPALFEIAKEKLDKEEKEREFFDVKLMLVKPDGTERKVLQVMKWGCREDDRTVLMYVKPEWSRDCKRLFYVRPPGHEENFYVGSIDIATGKMCAHLFGGLGIPVVSPNGNWVVSLSEEGREKALLTVARMDGNFHKYFRLDLKLPEGPLAYLAVAWFPDSEHLLIWAKEEGFRIMTTDTGEMEEYRDPNLDPNASAIAYPVFSATGNTLYYLAACEVNEPNGPKELISLKSMNLKDKKAQTVFILSDLPDLGGSHGVFSIDVEEGVGVFSISPNGKTVLLRYIVKDKSGIKRSAIFFWDGKSRKVVETDRWLKNPLYTDENLTFEKKLLGKWKAKDGEMLVSEGIGEKVYKMICVEKERKEQRYGANLVSVKGIKLLGVFFDESLAQKKGSDNSHLIPDFFFRIDQIKPKLLIKRMDYEEVAEMLKKDAESLKQAVGETANIIEFERIN